MEPVVVGAGHKGQALVGDLLRLDAGGAAGDRAGIRSPGDAGQDRLLRHGQSVLVIAVERGVDLVGGVSHIGAALPLGAVHVGVAHADGDGVQALLPQLIQRGVGGAEGLDPVAVEFALAVAELRKGHAGLGLDDQLGAGAPGIVFIALCAGCGDVGVLEIGDVLPIGIGVGIESQLFAGRRFQLEIRRELDVSGQLQHQGGVLGQLTVQIIGGVEAIAQFVEADREDDRRIERAEGQIPGPGNQARILPCGVVVSEARPVAEVVTGVEENVALGQHGGLLITNIIRAACHAVFVRRVALSLPACVRRDDRIAELHFKKQAGLGVFVPLFVHDHRHDGAVAAAAVERRKQRDDVFAGLEVCDLHLVVIRVIGRGPALERAVQNRQLAVYPEDVFVRRGDEGRRRGHSLVQRKGFAEGNVAVLGAGLRPDPVGRPIAFSIGLDGLRIFQFGAVRRTSVRNGSRLRTLRRF